MMSRIWIAPSAIFLVSLLLFVQGASQLVPLAEWWRIVTLPSTRMEDIILFYGAFPRAAVALTAGAALGLSGAILQQMLRNPIADPSTLGISAGAQLAIVVATLFFPEFLDQHRATVALAGAGIAAVTVFALGWARAFDPVTMVISGMLVGVTAAAVSVAMTLAQGEYLMSLVTWNGGSLSQQDWTVFRHLISQFVICGVLAALLVRPLALLSLGDTGAKSLGLSLRTVRFAAAAVATALAGFVAAGVGLVSFIGLAAPALVRACGGRTPAAILGFSPLAGALLLWLCDGLVHFASVPAGESFPTGSVTALIGGPLLLWLIPRMRSMDLQAEETSILRRVGLSAFVAPFLILLPLLLVVSFLVGRTGESWTVLSLTQANDLLPFRWPRLVAAGAAGGLLAFAGAVLQRMTGNPMASPEVIGVSGGAGLGYAAALTLAPAAGALTLFAGAGTGALLAMSVVLVYAGRSQLPPEKLLLAGIAAGSLSSSVLSALVALGDQRAWQILAWLAGSASSATPVSAILLVLTFVCTLVIGLGCSRWLTVMPLGENLARSLGLPIRLSRLGLLMTCGIATGAASLLVGPLSFIGLIAPHIAVRMGFATARHQLVASTLLGVLLMVVADFGARTVTFPYELPLGLFAALIGAPYLIWLVARR